jgi:hypothetical protein
VHGVQDALADLDVSEGDDLAQQRQKGPHCLIALHQLGPPDVLLLFRRRGRQLEDGRQRGPTSASGTTRSPPQSQMKMERPRPSSPASAAATPRGPRSRLTSARERPNSADVTSGEPARCGYFAAGDRDPSAGPCRGASSEECRPAHNAWTTDCPTPARRQRLSNGTQPDHPADPADPAQPAEV